MPKESKDTIKHLLKAIVGKLPHKIIKHDLPRKNCGFLPKMATDSKGSTGALLASSFCERRNLVANQVVANVNYSLAPDETDKLKTLLMSRDLMKHVRKSHDHSWLNNLEDCTEDKEEIESLNDNSL